MDGRSAPDPVQAAAARRGVDLSRHRSVRISQADVDWAEVILVMDRKNHDDLRRMAPSSLGKVVWLGAITDDEQIEIDDPYDLAEGDVDAVLRRIDEAVDQLGKLRGSTAIS